MTQSFVTRSNLGWYVSLSAVGYASGSETAMATANGNVLPTPYYIEIFDQPGTPLAQCGSGTTCSATFKPTPANSDLIAFISRYGTTFPPPGIVASSNEIISFPHTSR